MVLHDLRFVVDGDVAQIDHLILNRTGLVYLIETKNYAGDLTVNAQDEFTVQYDQDIFGIPSPWEQSRRHERILAKALERLEIRMRVDKQPDFHHVVMLSSKALFNMRSLDTVVEWGEKLKRQHRPTDLRPLWLQDWLPRGEFCWNNSQRFTGLQYCRVHQSLF